MNGPRIQFKTPSSGPGSDIEPPNFVSESTHKASHQASPLLKQRKSKHSPAFDSQQYNPGHNVYLGSYSRTTTHSASIDARAAPSPRASTFHLQLEPLLQAVDSDLETYGVEELRDGFFDTSFHRPLPQDHDQLMQNALETLLDPCKRNEPLSIRRFVPQQLLEARGFFSLVTTSRAGIKLLKTFLGFFITYIICLIPASRDWLGRYNYILVISAIINHPGRSIGAQIDGTFMTILGTAAGLAWGSLALYVSTSTPSAQSGYGGVLATFLIIFAAVIGWLRCVFIRFYQAVLAAGIAIFYTCLADASESVGWIKVFNYGMPWVLGQVVCLAVALVLVPDAGSRSIS